jgi:hypothetical protein
MLAPFGRRKVPSGRLATLRGRGVRQVRPRLQTAQHPERSAHADLARRSQAAGTRGSGPPDTRARNGTPRRRVVSCPCQRNPTAPEAPAELSQPHARPDHRARRLPAAAGSLSRQLVPGRSLPSAQRSAQFLGRPHSKSAPAPRGSGRRFRTRARRSPRAATASSAARLTRPPGCGSAASARGGLPTSVGIRGTRGSTAPTAVMSWRLHIGTRLSW